MRVTENTRQEETGVLNHCLNNSRGLRRPHITAVRRTSGINCGRELRVGSTVGLEESLFRMDPRPPPDPLRGESGWNPRPEPGPLPGESKNSELQQCNRSLQGPGSTFLQKFLPVQPTIRSIHAWPHSQSRQTESAAGGGLSQNSCCCVLKVRSQTKRGRIQNYFTSSL